MGRTEGRYVGSHKRAAVRTGPWVMSLTCCKFYNKTKTRSYAQSPNPLVTYHVVPTYTTVMYSPATDDAIEVPGQPNKQG